MLWLGLFEVQVPSSKYLHDRDVVVGGVCVSFEPLPLSYVADLGMAIGGGSARFEPLPFNTYLAQVWL